MDRNIFEDIEKYLNENMGKEPEKKGDTDFFEGTPIGNAIAGILGSLMGQFGTGMIHGQAAMSSGRSESDPEEALNEWMKQKLNETESFAEVFNKYLKEKGFVGNLADFYKPINMNRQLFSDISSYGNPSPPQKKTVFKAAIGLKASIEETETLLRSAGYCFNTHDKTDMIIKYCIEHLMYNPDEIDRYLTAFMQKPLFVIWSKKDDERLDALFDKK